VLVRILVLLGAGVWTFLFVPAALALTSSTPAQIAALAAGVVPLILLVRIGLSSSSREEPPALPSPKDRERELLAALEEQHEITVVAAAMRTSLTVDEATALLDDLARRGHVEVALRDGVMVYALRGGDRRVLPERAAAASPSVGVPAGGSLNGVGPEPDDTVYEALSERELEVLTLLNSGRSNREIAQELVISVGTVKSHTNNIYRKLGARNRAEALARARRLQLI
jgi:DNA-binding NarL/FixJ family response regulator